MDLRVADINFRIEAPDQVLAVLNATLCVVPRFDARAEPDIIVAVQRNDDAWEIRGHEGALKVLGGHSAMPQVGGAVVTSVIRDAAATRNFRTMRATVVERDGRALAMIGDDWESAITLAAHLHARGWSYIGSDNALLDPETLEVLPIQKSLYVNSSSVAQFPVQYRRAVEASPWYVTPQGISFYAVDPRHAGNGRTWSPSATLAGVVVVDGAMTERPSIESLDAVSLQSERFERFGLDWSRLATVDLRLGGFVDTCDLVEHWFGSIPT
jgi:hypothetical protein